MRVTKLRSMPAHVPRSSPACICSPSLYSVVRLLGCIMADADSGNDSDSDYDDTNADDTSGSVQSSERRPLLAMQPVDRSWCKNYRRRRLRSKAAVLVLLWNLLVFSYQFESLRSILKTLPGEFLSDPWQAACLATLFQDSIPRLLYPLTGWLADTKFGRYKVMRTSMWLMWAGSVVLLLVLILRYKYTYPLAHDHAALESGITIPALIVVYAVNSVGLAGFHANIIPFGLDQMEGGSGDQLSAFTHWYYWSRNFSMGLFVHAVLYVVFVCKEEGEEINQYPEPADRMDLVILAVEVGFLTLALALDFLFSDWLVKEPRTQNPLKTIRKISLFVMRHSRPVGRRSAFSYASMGRKLPSRSDLAKRLFGGPFESEDVESVKTFWNVIILLLSLGGGFFVIHAVSQV